MKHHPGTSSCLVDQIRYLPTPGLHILTAVVGRPPNVRPRKSRRKSKRCSAGWRHLEHSCAPRKSISHRQTRILILRLYSSNRLLINKTGSLEYTAKSLTRAKMCLSWILGASAWLPNTASSSSYSHTSKIDVSGPQQPCRCNGIETKSEHHMVCIHAVSTVS